MDTQSKTVLNLGADFGNGSLPVFIKLIVQSVQKSTDTQRCSFLLWALEE
jgi:hypothetical protein